MKKQLLTMALAVLTIGAMAQEKVRVHNGNSNYVTTIEQITFDVTDADQAISVTDLEAENDSLSTANATLTGEKTTLANEKTALSAKNDSLSTSNAKLAGEKTALATKNDSLATANAILAGEKASLETEKTALANEKTALSAKNDSLATANATLAGEKASLTNEKTALSAKNDSLLTSNAKLAGEKTALATKNDSLATANATLTSEKDALKADTTELNAQVNTLKSDTTNLKLEKQALEGQIVGLSDQVAGLKTDTTTLNGQIKALTSEKDALKADTTELNAQVNTLKADTTSLKLGKQALEGQIVGLNSQVEGLETDTTTLKAEIQTLNGKIKQMQFAYAPEDCYVDLGLSVMWATCNVGANAPEEYGDYFAWGEIEGYNSGRKTSFNWSTYKWCNGSSATMTKYCTSNSYGIVDNKKQLDLADDAARANWGGKWRMPTQAEWEELCNNTNQEWTDNYNETGVKGYVLTSTKQGYEGASIFLPAAGYRNEVGLDYGGSGGYYWSSSLYEYNSNNTSRRLYFNSGHFNMSSSTDRCYGHSVRPVCPPAEDVLKAERQALESQIVGLNSQVEGLKTDTTTLNGQVKTLTSEKATLAGEKAALETENSTLKGDKATLQNANAALTTENTALNAQVNTLKADTTSLKAEIQTLNGKIKTLILAGPANGHDYVDLGLSVMWATCNVGANAPEEFGDYFAWGETEGYNTSKKSFSWSTYKLCNGSNSTLTKYCTSNSYGTVDNKTQLDLADDAARANWGGNWRMPTVEEWDELDKNTTKKWTQVNGKSGYLLTSKVNGNSLFLPAAGYCGNGDIYYDGSDGYYWSSSLYGLNSDYGRSLYFGSGNFHPWYNGNRYNGQSVRPVCPSAK